MWAGASPTGTYTGQQKVSLGSPGGGKSCSLSSLVMLLCLPCKQGPSKTWPQEAVCFVQMSLDILSYWPTVQFQSNQAKTSKQHLLLSLHPLPTTHEVIKNELQAKFTHPNKVSHPRSDHSNTQELDKIPHLKKKKKEKFVEFEAWRVFHDWLIRFPTWPVATRKKHAQIPTVVFEFMERLQVPRRMDPTECRVCGRPRQVSPALKEKIKKKF